MSTRLEVKNLNVTASDGVRPLVEGVTFSLEEGQKLGLVGESGSGKSLICKSISGLLPSNLRLTADSLILQTKDGILPLKADDFSGMRAKYIGYVFQEPMSALNPAMTIGSQIAEALEISNLSTRRRKQLTLEWLQKVQIPEPDESYKKYPHQLSGGQRQRVIIAMAIIRKPALLIADEPTTALDQLVQAEIVELIDNLCNENGTMLIFVSHDLDLVGRLCENIMVLRHGRVLESGKTPEIFTSPNHPYTKALLLSKPRPGYKPDYLPVVADFLDDDQAGILLKKSYSSVADYDVYKGRILVVKSLHKTFRRYGRDRSIIRGIDLEILSGETVGIVGPSGCGKSTLARILCGVEKPDSGHIQYYKPGRRSDVIQLVFQDPFSSLNPQLSIGRQVMEPLLARGLSKAQAEAEAREMLHITGIDESRFHHYPHQFSGGQRQRIAIARALVLRPALLVLDESVAALDVSVQAVVINLLNDLKRSLSLSYLFITHNIIVAEYFCDRILIMYEGKFVDEWYSSDDTSPKHPFTLKLKKMVSASMSGR